MNNYQFLKKEKKYNKQFEKKLNIIKMDNNYFKSYI